MSYKALQTLAETYNGGDERRRSDKGTRHSYIEVYEELLSPYRKKRPRLLEIGVEYGYSLELWRDYFGPEGFVWGIDRVLPKETPEGVGLLFGDMMAASGGVINRLPSGWDVIIDDASHVLHEQAVVFLQLAPKLAPGGIYVIEDIQSDGDLVVLMDELTAYAADYGGTVNEIDLREVKGRYDDRLLVYRAPKPRASRRATRESE